ncbi:hypothetical protein IU450_35955 [Nocardia abscessus]|uniref:hypothetical protein n=1 Tax=Nocardia abscessus TaxID=120957 RepID=UPI00189393B3|nr:hypothetical protein [Nocardia abscessus]MBF6341236.1 hypothetical protein [Nocardia abscessus]
MPIAKSVAGELGVPPDGIIFKETPTFSWSNWTTIRSASKRYAAAPRRGDHRRHHLQGSPGRCQAN